MWRMTRMATQVQPVEAFMGFLESDTFISQFRFGHYKSDTPCLFDIIQAWVGDGDATDVCPTFEIFLLTVIDIIGCWESDGERRAIIQQPLWPEKQLPQGDEYYCTPGIVIDEIDDSGIAPSAGTWLPSYHPVLRRENFELTQARRRNTERS